MNKSEIAESYENDPDSDYDNFEEESQMEKCTHPRLIQVENPEGGISTTYQCDECKDLLTVSIKPFTIEVAYGVPDAQS